MTPDEWLVENDNPTAMVEAAWGCQGFLHFSLACCRRYWLLLRPDIQKLVEWVESGKEPKEIPVPSNYGMNPCEERAWDTVMFTPEESALHWSSSWDNNLPSQWMCEVLRDVVDGICPRLYPVALWGAGASNRLAVLSPAGPVNLLVRQLAEGRGELDSLTVLALGDALEEAGSINYALLAHLRSGTPHVRGCRGVKLLKCAIQEGA